MEILQFSLNKSNSLLKNCNFHRNIAIFQLKIDKIAKKRRHFIKILPLRARETAEDMTRIAEFAILAME